MSETSTESNGVAAGTSFIADDVARQLITAGRPVEEAQASGRITQALYETHAARFNGWRGTAEDIYRREGPEIRGPDGAAPPPPPAARVPYIGQPGLVAQGLDEATAVKDRWRAETPYKDSSEMLLAAPRNQARLSNVADGIAKALGISFKDPGTKSLHPDEIEKITDLAVKANKLKGYQRFTEKAAARAAPGEVTDLVRAGFKVNSPAESDYALQRLAQSFEVIDEGWFKTPEGYFDRKAYVRFHDGMIGEIQFWEPTLLDAKENGGGHQLYEKWRSPDTPPEEKADLREQMRNLYDRTAEALPAHWNAVSGRGGSEGNLAANAAGESTLPSWEASPIESGDQTPSLSTSTSGAPRTETSGLPSNTPTSAPAGNLNIAAPPEVELTPDQHETASAISEAAAQQPQFIQNEVAATAKKDAELLGMTSVPEFTPASAASVHSQTPSDPAGSFFFDPTKLLVDPERFQFKSGGDEFGVTGALRKVVKWDKSKAQVIMVWQDKEGNLFVVDGHQRTGLAKRLIAQGLESHIEIIGQLYREVDGVDADFMRAKAAITNIANGSGSALDGAKVLRARPEMMDGSIPLTEGKGKQSADLAKLNDESFRMVINGVVKEHFGAIVGELIPHDGERQVAAMKAISRFEPRSVEEASALTQRVAQAELAKASEGSQMSMFGDLETPESTAGEEMKIVGRAIKDLEKDKALFARVLSNAERIEETGSTIARETAKTVASDAGTFARQLASDAYSAGPVRTALLAAARDLKDGKIKLGEASSRIHAALRAQAEVGGSVRADNFELAQELQGAGGSEAGAVTEPVSGAGERGSEGGGPVAAGESFEQRVARHRAQRARASALVDHALSQARPSLILEKGDKTLVLSKGLGEYPLRITDFDKNEPTGHRDYTEKDREGVYSMDAEIDGALRDGFTVRGGEPKFEPGAEGLPQQLIPGVEPITDRQRLEAQAAKPLQGGNRPAGGLFDEDARAQDDLFQGDQKAAPGLKRWFGDSKVVDENGAPRVVYHGSVVWKNGERQLGDIHEFDRLASVNIVGRKPSIDTTGIWFQEDPSETGASMYSGSSGTVYPVYLKIENPWEPGSFEEMRRKFHETAGRNPDKLPKGTTLNGGSAEPFRAWLKEQGYDGIHLSGDIEGGGKNPDRNQSYWVALEPTQVKSAIANKGSFNPTDPRILEQRTREGEQGRINIRPNARTIITLAKTANASTFMHETAHDWLERLLTDAEHPQAPDDIKADVATVRKYLSNDGEALTKRQHERFARSFEQYLREGRAPSPALASVFAKFKQWLTAIYKSLQGLGSPINDDIRGVFDRMLAGDPARTVIAPDRAEAGPNLADIHRADAAEIEHPENEAAAERVAAERERHIQEPPQDIAHETAPHIAEHDAQNAASDIVAGAENEASAGAPGALDGGSGEPAPVAKGGALGASGGGVSAGGDQASAKVPPNTPPLAPRPAENFGESESKFVDKAGNIRVENLTNSADVAKAIHDIAAANDDFIGDRRGVVTPGQVSDLADDIGETGATNLVEKWVRGQAYNAEQVVALRRLLRASAAKVSDAMKKAAEGTDQDVLAYAEARNRHQMIQRTVAGATAEAGRALAAFRDISGETKSVDDFIKSATGKTLFQMREEAKLGAAFDTTPQISKYMKDMQRRDGWSGIIELWINNLISGPATHSTYAVGNTILAAQRAVPETAAAAGIGAIRKALGREGSTVQIGEVGQKLRGAVTGTAPAMHAALDSVEHGTTGLLPGENDQPGLPFQPNAVHAYAVPLDEAGKLSQVMPHAFGIARGTLDGILANAALIATGGIKEAPFLGLKGSPLGVIPDITVKGVNVLPIGTMARAPSRLVAAIHSFFRATNYSMEKNALAYRAAVEEGRTGTDLAARIADLRQNPTTEIMDAARSESTQNTLMGQGSELVNKLAQLTNMRVLGMPLPKFIDPFVKIAGNIIDQSIVQRSPVGLLSPEVRADLSGKNGTVAADTAAAKMLVGVTYAIAGGILASRGLMTGSGPSDPKKAQMWKLGYQPHSVLIGDTWYQTNRLGPIGMLFGVSADLYDVAHTISEGDATDIAHSITHAFVQNILDESFMRGPADLIKALEEPDRYGAQYYRTFLSSFVPYSVGLSQVSRATDPYSRQARSLMDTIRSKIPGMSEELLPRRDIWGEPVPSKDTLGPRVLSAIYAQQVATDPVNIAMIKLGMGPSQPPRQIRNVDLTDQEYDDFSRISGRAAKIALNVLVNSPDFQRWPSQVRVDTINHTIRTAREQARGAVMAKYPHIMRDATDAKLEGFKPDEAE